MYMTPVILKNDWRKQVNKTIATILVILIASIAIAKPLTPSEGTEGQVYRETGVKLPTPVGDTVIWFRHTAARDTFMARLNANPEMYRVFALPKWKEPVSE